MTTPAASVEFAAASAPPMSRSEVHPALGILLILALWTLARPYVGLRHDGILYLGQTLLQLAPETMSRDVFFQYGSQDSYSLVAPLLAWMVSAWGVGPVQMVVPTLCHVAMLNVAFLLLRDLSSRERWLGLAALAVMSHTYSGYGIFAFAERFVTGRTFAEPLALLALYLVWRRRPVAGLVAIVLAASMHPLVALPAIFVGWLTLCLQDKRWRWAGVALLVPGLLAWLGVAPFDALLQSYDDAWWQAVVTHNGQVLLSIWQAVDWQLVVFDFAVLGAAARVLPASLRPLLEALLVAAVALLVVSAVGADAMRNVLITQLQVWRVLWLTHLFALLCLPALGLWVWRLGPEGRLTALALAAAATAVNARWETGWMLMAWTAGTAWLATNPGRVSTLVLRAATTLTGATLVGLSAFVVVRIAGLLAQEGASVDAGNVTLVAFTLPLFGMSAAAIALWAHQQGRLTAVVALAVCAVLAGYGLSAWDRRNAWTKFIESGLERTHPFAAHIPPTAQVYWADWVAATWVVLRRPSYYSKDQSTGLLFNRATAVEYRRRHEVFAALRLQVDVCGAMSALNGESDDSHDCYPTDEVMKLLCRIPSGPDFMVFQRRTEIGHVAEWTFRADGKQPRTFHLYDCAQLR